MADTLPTATDALLSAARGGDRRAILASLAELLAESIVSADPDKRAPLAKQLADVTRELDTLVKPKGSKVDDLAARRKARRDTAPQDLAPAAVDD
jgi:hypothetical protein